VCPFVGCNFRCCLLHSYRCFYVCTGKYVIVYAQMGRPNYLKPELQMPTYLSLYIYAHGLHMPMNPEADVYLWMHIDIPT
jgi:hypothetical protein